MLTCALDFFFFPFFKCKQAVLISVELVLQNAISEVHRMMQDQLQYDGHECGRVIIIGGKTTWYFIMSFTIQCVDNLDY